MCYDALLIVDMQNALTEGKPYRGAAVVENIRQLLLACRARGIPVVYVQHDGGAGDELEHGSAAWQIEKKLTPMPGDAIFEKKYNSAFRETGLREFLSQLPVKNIILCGMQTEYCIDATCKVAFEYGFHVVIGKGTTTTFDSEFAGGERLAQYFEDKIWNGRYADVVPLEDLISELNA